MENSPNFKIALFLLITLTSFCTACNDGCNDCLDLTSKNILLVNASGTNLLFGDDAIYNPENVSIRNGNEELSPVLIDEGTGTLQFFLAEDVMEYQVVLSESEIETLSFELAERNSERCCGTQTFTTGTRLNGNEIENTDIITIIK
ncbi:hypothetical protein [Ulvibacterium sp.]|uniref:hypothetical protein n=1 Tax=Ulvibacterium sp. TaxID=2665914 RepID=UPI002639632F|nr:hypothetical protein [Ulvibacterium sp.]